MSNLPVSPQSEKQATTLWMHFSPWVEKMVIPLVTVAAGVVGAAGGYFAQIYKQKLDHSEKFVEKALDKNLETRYRLAQYFGTLSDTKEGWKSYYELIKNEYDLSKKKKMEILLSIAGLDADLDELRDEKLEKLTAPEKIKNLRERKILQAKLIHARSELAMIDDQLKVNFDSDKLRQETVVTSGWVYLGQKAGDSNKQKWVEKTTDSSDVPKVGDTIRVLTNLYLRESAPIVSIDRTIPGKSLTVISFNEMLKIVALSPPNFKNTFWAQVERIGPAQKTTTSTMQ